MVQAEYQTGLELATQCLSLAQRVHDPALLLVAHHVLGGTEYHLGELTPGQAHLEQGLALYDRQQHHHLAFRYGLDLGVWCLSYIAWPLWLLGYPDQALTRSHEAITLAQELSHPLSLAAAFDYAAFTHCYRREGHATQERAEAGMALSSEKGFPQYVALGMIMRGWALAVQGQGEEGITQLLQGMAAQRAAGIEETRHVASPCSRRPTGRWGRQRQGSPRWPRRWQQRTALGNAFGRQSSSGARVSSCWYVLRGMIQRRKPAFVKPSMLPAASRRSRGSCARP
jgi:hypothetical protein